MAASASLSALPSSLRLSFPTERPSTSSHSSSSCAFINGGINLRLHKSFSYVTSSSFSSRRVSTNRLVSVLCASGDYYSTLGVAKSASSKEIKAAYRKLARQVRYFVQFGFHGLWFRTFFCSFTSLGLFFGMLVVERMS
ncbi:hypothetical protein SLEP1_g52553 [Rubroshorea leprosula]|uniref:J domain-containing protein n=1 Tax=Rubroshorea leprosula TaxID=152421 RepID=A0AAV5M6T3_9ROSI|nr:hypothetical protein SLEP1_g52553 [Rubroshorea leprosula]